MRQYVLSVICASLICGTVLSIIKEGAAGAVGKLLCGAMLACTVLSPLAGLDIGRELARLPPNDLEAGRLTAAGENMAREALADIIKEKAETYILDKATDLHGDIQVTITLSKTEPQIPVGAVLSGRVSPYVKGELERVIQTDLGIPKENVRWTG